ncbi:signal peptidase II [Candidatus Collierbacteria bacterium]|nr:signal peptidase II [Candidatus Collierbacteria bacterium]
MKLKLFILFVASDQILKLLAIKFFQPVFNTGIAFGFGENIPRLIILIVFILLSLWVYKSKSGLGEMLLLAGGAGNILDRLIYGKIVDWIRFGNLWFNLADGYIAVGVTLIIIKIIFIRTLKHENMRA